MYRAFILAAVMISGAAMNFAQAGSENGPGYQDTSVLPFGTDYFEEVYYGGEMAEVVIQNDGSNPLQVRIWDADGDLGPTGYANPGGQLTLRWNPIYADLFTIELVNDSDDIVPYRITTN